MALPGHSPPPPFTGPGSPTRLMNGESQENEHNFVPLRLRVFISPGPELPGHIDTQLPPMYGPSARSMLPPSPQSYRFPNPPPPMPVPSPSLITMSDNRANVPHKRPGSSMSISSMLGGEPEKLTQEAYPNHHSRGPSRQGSISGPGQGSFLAMSPPQQPSKSGLGEYSYKPRSQTPDGIGPSLSTVGVRQRSSSSGTPLQRPPHFAEFHNRAASTIPTPRYLEHSPSLGLNGSMGNRNEHDEKVRRTSINGILQRPNSQPQPTQNTNHPQDLFRQHPTSNPGSERQPQQDPGASDPFSRNGVGTTYDIQPPGSQNIGHPSAIPAISPVRVPSMPESPELRRPGANGSQARNLASLLNGPLNPQPPEAQSAATHRMARQDSAQSQNDRSVFTDRGKIRQYSPFASSFAPQGQTADEQGRKGSDEVSLNRALLGLAAESKRGRHSPMPQVVQGAQAQTARPDFGVKTEHGRVFAGLGGGVSTTPTPVNSMSKRDDGRAPLSEDNLMKMSRSTSGVNKRSRNLHDDDLTGEADPVSRNKPSNGRSSKKGKYQHSYKHDLEEMAIHGQQRRNTPLSNLNQMRSSSMSTSAWLGAPNHMQQSQYQRTPDLTPIFKPKKTIKVASVFNMASRAPRRHLGHFTYRPEIAQRDLKRSASLKFDVSIRPNLLPSFSAAEHVNCTYTIHVPKTWLQERERSLICAEQYLWGSGIYTDDSDPIAAAIHAGFLKTGLGDGVDTSLLSRMIQEQNPKIEWPRDLQIPEQPMDIEVGKDLNITLVVLPLLERYEGSARFGIKSRSWPEGTSKTQHDGVSFGVLRVEFANVGTEEMRMGRTGASRRERLRMDLEARQRSLKLQEERIAKAKQRRLDRLKLPEASTFSRSTKSNQTSVPIKITTGMSNSIAHQVVAAVA